MKEGRPGSGGMDFRSGRFLQGFWMKFLQTRTLHQWRPGNPAQRKGRVDRPTPKLIEEAVCEIMENHSGTLNVLFVEKDTLLVLDWDCPNLSVYNPTEDVQYIWRRLRFQKAYFGGKRQIRYYPKSNRLLF